MKNNDNIKEKAGSIFHFNKKKSRLMQFGVLLVALLVGVSSLAMGDWFITSDEISGDSFNIGSTGLLSNGTRFSNSESNVLNVYSVSSGVNDTGAYVPRNMSGMRFWVNNSVHGCIGVYDDRLNIGFREWNDSGGFVTGDTHGMGDNAFWGGVLLDDGTVVMIPYYSDNVGLYDPSTDTFNTGDTHGMGDYAFSGGVLLDDGTVVMIPYNSDNVGLYDPSTDTFNTGDTHGMGNNAFRGGVLLDDGTVVMIPFKNDNVGLYTMGTNLNTNDIVLRHHNETTMVGINTSNPTGELHVTGDIFYTGTSSDVSDKRVKDVIGELPENEVRLFCENVKFKFFHYLKYTETTVIGNQTYNMINFTGEDTGRDGVGLIAQELYENLTVYFPTFVDEFVVKGDDNKLWGVDYSKVSAVFCRYTQLLHEDIESLDARITALENP